jgi:hypothetical protein
MNKFFDTELIKKYSRKLDKYTFALILYARVLSLYHGKSFLLISSKLYSLPKQIIHDRK